MTKSLLYITVGALLSMGAVSCSALKGVGEKSAKARPEVLPTDRENVHKDKADREYSSEELASGTIKGDWAIEQVYGEHPKGERTAPFLRFVPSEKRVYGNNGCNVLNATYAYNPADSTLSFGNVASTMMLCAEEGLREAEIGQALGSACRYTWSTRDTQYLLHLYDAAGVEVMTLMHQNFQFLNGTWGVAAIGQRAIDDPDMKLVIDVDEGRIHGNTGCNLLNGLMEIDMEAANSISFSSMATTRRACEDPERQTAFLVALEDATTARPLDADRVALLNAAGETVLVLFRTTDK